MEEKKKQENALENIFPRHPIIKIVMKVRFLERRIQEAVDREDFPCEGFFKLFFIFLTSIDLTKFSTFELGPP